MSRIRTHRFQDHTSSILSWDVASGAALPGSLRRMADVEDVAAAILDRQGPMDAYKLQKLVYFAQTVSLAWRDTPLFEEEVQAFKDGPVVYPLFKLHQGRYTVSRIEGHPNRIDEAGQCVIDFVCGMYGEKTGRQLSAITHGEGPWRAVRERVGLRDGQWGMPVIPKGMLREYGRSKPEFMEQAWFWTPEWQLGERAAQVELEGRVGSLYESDDDFKSALA